MIPVHHKKEDRWSLVTMDVEAAKLRHCDSLRRTTDKAMFDALTKFFDEFLGTPTREWDISVPSLQCNEYVTPQMRYRSMSQCPLIIYMHSSFLFNERMFNGLDGQGRRQWVVDSLLGVRYEPPERPRDSQAGNRVG